MSDRRFLVTRLGMAALGVGWLVFELRVGSRIWAGLAVALIGLVLYDLVRGRK
ncbi:MAG: hypothetical protein KC620_09435 [Myxococcales bacterium]|nr:hypothetical protein [Myxococcales bacterium]